MANKAIKINLYDGNDQVIRTLSRSRIPWGVLKQAIRLADTLDDENIGADDLDNIAVLICDVFSGDVTVDELDKHADIGEMMDTIQGVMDRAAATVPNPKPPVPK